MNTWLVVLVILVVLAYLIHTRTTFSAAVKDRRTKNPSIDPKDSAEVFGVIAAGIIWYLFMALIYGGLLAIAFAAVNYGR